jgi:hypothetical protein
MSGFGSLPYPAATPPRKGYAPTCSGAKRIRFRVSPDDLTHRSYVGFDTEIARDSAQNTNREPLSLVTAAFNNLEG